MSSLNERRHLWVSFKKALAVGLALTAMNILFGCGSGSNGGGPKPPTLPKAASPIGYGLPNYWHTIDPVAFAASLSEAGLNLTVIELVPWFTAKGSGCKHNGGLSDQTFPQEAAEFIEAMRAEGIATIVFGINANNCKTKQWGLPQFEHLNAFVTSFGPSLVWYLPVNEPWADDHSFTSLATGLARRTWHGTFLVADNGWNRATGHPYFGVVRDYLTVNACTDEAAFDALESGHQVLVTTDCTGTLNPGPDRAAHLTKIALQTKTPFVVYDFRGETPDLAVIAAMGAEVSRAP